MARPCPKRWIVRVLVLSDIYHRFIEPTITRVPLCFFGCMWFDTKIVVNIYKFRLGWIYYIFTKNNQFDIIYLVPL